MCFRELVDIGWTQEFSNTLHFEYVIISSIFILFLIRELAMANLILISDLNMYINFKENSFHIFN